MDLSSRFNQPYVVLIGIGGAITALLFMAISRWMEIPEGFNFEKAAFILSVIVLTTLVTKAAISMKSDAPASATTLFFSGAFVLICIVGVLQPDFKDVAFEGVCSAFGAAFAALLDEAINRSNRIRGITLPE